MNNIGFLFLLPDRREKLPCFNGEDKQLPLLWVVVDGKLVRGNGGSLWKRGEMKVTVLL